MSEVYFISIKNKEATTSLAEKAVSLIEKSGLTEKITKDDFTAIKTHFGEVGNIGHIHPTVIKNVADTLKAKSNRVFVAETNTLYAGSRSNSAEHTLLANKHGFGIDRIGVPIIIADGLKGRNFTSIKVSGRHFKEVKIASDIIDCDYMVCLSHITGHMQAGVGGAIKNLGMGCASRAGKLEQHSSVLPEVLKEKCIACGVCMKWCPTDAITIKNGKASIDENKCIGCGECTVVCKVGAVEIKWSEEVKMVQEKIAEYALGVQNAIGKKNIFYINFVNHITKDCDCMARDEAPICDDIGIMASWDPVAVDSASINAVLETNGYDIFKKGYPKIDWSSQLIHGESIGLGSRIYEIEPILI